MKITAVAFLCSIALARRRDQQTIRGIRNFRKGSASSVPTDSNARRLQETVRGPLQQILEMVNAPSITKQFNAILETAFQEPSIQNLYPANFVQNVMNIDTPKISDATDTMNPLLSSKGLLIAFPVRIVNMLTQGAESLPFPTDGSFIPRLMPSIHKGIDAANAALSSSKQLSATIR